MNLNIAEHIKQLRKQRGITQEDLAGFLGVSFQAVSKWERGDGYPDITILPSIANFFGVTLDELVGMNELRNEKMREEMLSNARLFASEGRIAETISTLREGLKSFPNDYDLMAELACYLDGFGETEDERRKNRGEAIALSERVLEFCTDGKLRNNVQSNLCFTLWRNGETEKAIRIAENLPNLYHTSDATLPRLLTGEEKIRCCQTAIQRLHWEFWWIINQMIEETHYTDEEKIALLQKSIAIYGILYENKDYGFSHIRLADAYEDIAVLLLQNDRADEAFAHLEKCVDHAMAYDRISGDVKHTSLCVNMLTFNKQNTSKSTEANCSRNILNTIRAELAEGGLYERHREDARLKRIIERLEATAN